MKFTRKKKKAKKNKTSRALTGHMYDIFIG